MPWLAGIPRLLQAFLGLLIRPFRQSQADSLRGAGTAITLAGTITAIGGRTVPDAAPSSLALVLVWMAVTAAVTKTDRGLKIARNLGVVSFWIATTAALILASEQVYADDFDRGPRFYFVVVWLLVLVPVHMIRNLPFWTAIVMTVALWASTVFLAATIVY